MAFRHICAAILLIIQLTIANSNQATPLHDCAKFLTNEKAVPMGSIPPGSGSTYHPVSKRSAPKLEKRNETNIFDNTGLQQTEDILRLAALLPAETLQLLRKVAVPLLNTSLAVPANILEEASKLSFADLKPGNWTNNATSWMNVSGIVVSPAQRFHNFNLTSLEMQANTTMHDKFLTPVGSFLKMSANKTRNAMPIALDSDHMKRHFENLKRYLVARQNVTATRTTTNPPKPDS